MSPQPALGQDSAPTLLGAGGGHPTLSAKPSCCLPYLQEVGKKTGGVQGSGNIPSMSSAPKPCHLSRQFFVRAHWEQLGLLSQTAGCRSAEGMNAPAYGTHLLPQQGEVPTRNQPVAQQHRQKQCPGTRATASPGKGVGAPQPIQGTAEWEGVAGHPQAPCGMVGTAMVTRSLCDPTLQVAEEEEMSLEGQREAPKLWDRGLARPSQHPLPSGSPIQG